MLDFGVFNICRSNEKLTTPALALMPILAAGAASLALAIVPAAAQTDTAAAPAACGAPERAGEGAALAEPVHVESVDIHLELRLRNGRKIRLRGLEPPRGTPTNPALAEEARLALAGWLEGEKAQSSPVRGEPDRWGRHEAALFMPAPGQGARLLHAAAHLNVASHLIANGWGRVDPAGLTPDCAKWLYQQEQAARSAALGLWSDPHYQVIDAANPGDFSTRGGQIVLIEGLVSSVGALRTLSFINLGPRRGRDPALVVSRRIATGLERAGVKVATLPGQRIRARGILQITDENRKSLRIEIVSDTAIERLTPSAAPRQLQTGPKAN